MMSANIDRFKTALTKLIELGATMYCDLTFRQISDRGTLSDLQREAAKMSEGIFETDYQRWYSEAAAVIKQLMPDRYAEFTHLYYGDGKRKQVDCHNYNIQDWLKNIRSEVDYVQNKVFNDIAIVYSKFSIQLDILKAVQSRFDGTLFDIAQIVRADLFDSELDTARELINSGFLRGAGAIAGVVVEKHLKQVCTNHRVVPRKQHPTISDFNDLLKTSDVLDVPTWRQIQRLGDIRNLCVHNKQREPTKDEVVELIAGAERLCKMLF